MTPHTVQVEAIILAAHTGAVALALGPDVDEEEVLESMMEELTPRLSWQYRVSCCQHNLGKLCMSLQLASLFSFWYPIFDGWPTLLPNQL